MHDKFKFQSNQFTPSPVKHVNVVARPKIYEISKTPICKDLKSNWLNPRHMLGVM